MAAFPKTTRASHRPLPGKLTLSSRLPFSSPPSNSPPSTTMYPTRVFRMQPSRAFYSPAPVSAQRHLLVIIRSGSVEANSPTEGGSLRYGSPLVTSTLYEPLIRLAWFRASEERAHRTNVFFPSPHCVAALAHDQEGSPGADPSRYVPYLQAYA